VKSSSPSRKISDAIRQRGPITVAAFMDLALYDSDIGYYARAAQRSGRAGDFFTSVDVGPIFGELLEQQIAEMAAIVEAGLKACAPTTGNVAEDTPVEAGLKTRPTTTEETLVGQDFSPASSSFDLIEAGAGNGRLSADILRAMKRRDPAIYDRLRLHLVEASAAARAAQAATLGDVADRIASSSAALPDRFEGVLVANELLDALPAHQVVMRAGQLREVYVDARAGTEGFTLVEGPPSTPALIEYLERLGVILEDGWRVEINLQAIGWVREAARRLARGFIILIDYGHDAQRLYSASHAGGTLTTFSRHTSRGPEQGPDPSSAPAWLQRPGDQDITAHVDFTSVRDAASAEGCTTLGFVDQTYFLMGILGSQASLDAQGSTGADLRTRMCLKTLLMPGGLGSTHKVLILGKRVGTPKLMGVSFGGRVT
jgi:SAM-dependent MidA family methyltransferase